MKTELDFERNASLGFFRNIAILIGFMLLGFALFAMCGCATIRSIITDESVKELAIEQLDRLADKWVARMEKLPPVVTPDKPDPDKPTPDKPSPATGDQVEYNALAWSYGGFKGGGAVWDRVTISSLSVKSSGMSIRWESDLKAWGLSHGDAGALACLFCKVDGRWVGGKFDWISSSRSTRDFKNVHNGYNGWSKSDFDRAEAYAFVVVSSDGKRRSNVIMSGAK